MRFLEGSQNKVAGNLSHFLTKRCNWSFWSYGPSKQAQKQTRWHGWWYIKTTELRRLQGCQKSRHCGVTRWKRYSHAVNWNWYQVWHPLSFYHCYIPDLCQLNYKYHFFLLKPAFIPCRTFSVNRLVTLLSSLFISIIIEGPPWNGVSSSASTLICIWSSITKFSNINTRRIFDYQFYTR